MVFRQAPDYLFRDLELEHIPSNHLTIRVQPDEGISLAFQAKTPGPGYHLQTVRMDFDYDESFTDASAEAYERLLHDAMDGDHTLFNRADSVDRAWEIVTPMLQEPPPLFHYAQGSLGSLPRGPPDRTARMAPAHARRRHDGPPLMTFIDISLPIGPDLLDVARQPRGHRHAVPTDRRR